MPVSFQSVQQLAHTAGLRVRDQDAEALSHWTAERLHKLALLDIEHYALLLAEIERGRGTLYEPFVADTCLKLFRENNYVIPQ